MFHSKTKHSASSEANVSFQSCPLGKQTTTLTLCMLGNFFMILLSSGDFFKINFFKRFFLKHYKGVKRFGSRSDQQTTKATAIERKELIFLRVKVKGVSAIFSFYRFKRT